MTDAKNQTVVWSLTDPRPEVSEPINLPEEDAVKCFGFRASHAVEVERETANYWWHDWRRR